jgi:hypothetical protein
MKPTARAIQGSTILLLALIVFVGIAGCVGGFAPPPTPNTVDMEAAHWNLLWGAGVPSHPAPSQPGWQFNIPAAPGSVHYVQVPFNATEDLTGKTLTLTFRMVSSDAVYNASVDPHVSGPASFHLFLERRNDDFTNPYYRWWCYAGGYTLGTQDNQTVTVSCPLDYTAWSSVYAGQDKTQFTNTLNNLDSIGVTFGGSGGWGHGVNLLRGSAQFRVLDAHIGVPDPPSSN